MTRTKVLLVGAVLVLAVVLGATAAPARSARSTAWKTWCGKYATKLPTHSMAASLICPGSRSTRSKNTGARQETDLGSLNRQIASAINSFRQAHGLVPLRISYELDASARQHSWEMGADGYFDHNSADGTLWWKRIQHYYPSTNYTYWTAGENLLFDTPDVSAAAAMKLWIGSPDHLRNLMDPNWRNLGVSSVHVIDAGGVYENTTVTIITTDFGARH